MKEGFMLNLVKAQMFEHNNALKIGIMKCDFIDKRMANNWNPTERAKSKSTNELKIIQKVINQIMDKYDTFKKITDECDSYYNTEVDYISCGLLFIVDLFAIEGNFNYWIRLIPQKGERNIYISVFDKK